MKTRILTQSLAIALALWCVAPMAPAAADGRQIVRKLGRGLANAGGGVLEIPVNIYAMNQERGPVAAMSWGLLIGLGRTIARTVVGVAEIVTFPFPIPQGYEPIMQPEFLLHPEDVQE
ncbi:MAG: exosortase system-associated protein, TIGR04073 family [Candidatus Omnitrophica bacterium]|nr:exosortase system-associated protein, TIGR04073 family [Candidatus Omnitrophota bacterium]